MTTLAATKMAPSMTVTAAATDRTMTSRTLLVVAVLERTAQRSHRGYHLASHMASRNHYDRDFGAAPPSLKLRIGCAPPLKSLTWHFLLRQSHGSASGRGWRYVMCMITQADKAEQFLALHRAGTPLLMPNPWDLGSARLLASLGFEALATTSSGFAATLGRNDGSVTRNEALVHAAVIVAATDLPVSADLENAFADSPAGVAETIGLAIEVGLAGASVEDFTGRVDDPIYDTRTAAERVAAAAEAAHAGPVHLVLTARAENYLHGHPDLTDTIARLQAYQEAGADVLYAPGLHRLEDIRQVIREVDRPVNVLPVDGAPTVAELAEVGVSRISVGGSFAFAALGAVVSAATELREQGTYGYRAGSIAGAAAARRAFS